MFSKDTDKGSQSSTILFPLLSKTSYSSLPDRIATFEELQDSRKYSFSDLQSIAQVCLPP